MMKTLSNPALEVEQFAEQAARAFEGAAILPNLEVLLEVKDWPEQTPPAIDLVIDQDNFSGYGIRRAEEPPGGHYHKVLLIDSYDGTTHRFASVAEAEAALHGQASE